MDKLLSVIVPMYNSATWLPKCLDSIFNQGLDDTQLEVICINDGSPDYSADIANRYQELHPQSVVILTQDNQGPSGARNNGIRHATGKYLCFVDPDDYVEPQCYIQLLRQMEEENLDALRFNYVVEDENYHPTQECKHPLPFNYTPKLMTGTEFIGQRLGIQCYIWLYIFKRAIITDNQIWCYVGDYYDDTPWLPRVLMKVERMNVTPMCVQHYMVRSDSLVRGNTPRMVEKKINGLYFLIKTLCQQLSIVKDQHVRNWYAFMLSHSAMSLLSLVCHRNPVDYKQAISFMKQYHLFPLSMKKVLFRNKLKVALANVSPKLYCWIMGKR